MKRVFNRARNQVKSGGRWFPARRITEVPDSTPITNRHLELVEEPEDTGNEDNGEQEDPNDGDDSEGE